MSWLGISFIIVLVLLTVCLFAIVNLLNKVEKYEDINQILSKKLESTAESAQRLFFYIQQSKEHIDRIDNRGIFQSHDEVGSFFDYLKEIQNSLNTLIEDAKKEEEIQQ